MKSRIQVSVKTEWSGTTLRLRQGRSPRQRNSDADGQHVTFVQARRRFVHAAGVRLAQAVETSERFMRRVDKTGRRAQMIDSITPMNVRRREWLEQRISSATR